MATLDIRDELDILALETEHNGINGEPVVENIEGWHVTKSANGRRVARRALDIDIRNYTELGELRKGTLGFSTVYLTPSVEENLPTGVFTDIPEQVTCEWRNTDDRLIFVDNIRSTVNMVTTGKHSALIFNTVQQTIDFTTVLVEWVIVGY